MLSFQQPQLFTDGRDFSFYIHRSVTDYLPHRIVHALGDGYCKYKELHRVAGLTIGCSFMPRWLSDIQGALVGAAVAALSVAPIMIPTQIYLGEGLLHFPAKPVSIEGCSHMYNMSKEFLKTVKVPEETTWPVGPTRQVTFRTSTLSSSLQRFIRWFLQGWCPLHIPDFLFVVHADFCDLRPYCRLSRCSFLGRTWNEWTIVLLRRSLADGCLGELTFRRTEETMFSLLILRWGKHSKVWWELINYRYFFLPSGPWRNAETLGNSYVKNVLRAPIFFNIRNFGTKRDRTKKLKSNSLISWRSNDFISWFSYVHLSVSKLRRCKKIETRNTSLTAVLPRVQMRQLLRHPTTHPWHIWTTEKQRKH